MDPLDGCRAKIERANEHIKNLSLEYSAHANSGQYRIVQEYDTANGILVLKFADVKTLPTRLSVIIGDALHQLRSALDHSIHQLILKNGGIVTKKTQFPVFQSHEGYVARGHPMISGLSVPAAALIESFQPYQLGTSAGEHPLWVLAELNNADKHRLLLVTAITMEGPLEFEFKSALTIDTTTRRPGEFDLCVRHGGQIENGATFASFRTTAQEVQMESQISSAVAFQEDGFSRGKPVIPLLTETSAVVAGVIDRLGSEFK